MANFTTFGQFATYLRGVQKSLPKLQESALVAIGKYIRDTIKAKHGVKQSGWPKGMSKTPLKKTGELAGAVQYIATKEQARIFSTKSWLAIIHEYGITMRMTDKQRKYLFGVVLAETPLPSGKPKSGWGTGMITIPARPIWRTILQKEQGKVQSIADRFLTQLFV